MRRFYQIHVRRDDGTTEAPVYTRTMLLAFLTESRVKSEPFTVAGAMRLIDDEQTFCLEFGTFSVAIEFVPTHFTVRAVKAEGGTRYELAV